MCFIIIFVLVGGYRENIYYIYYYNKVTLSGKLDHNFFLATGEADAVLYVLFVVTCAVINDT